MYIYIYRYTHLCVNQHARHFRIHAHLRPDVMFTLHILVCVCICMWLRLAYIDAWQLVRWGLHPYVEKEMALEYNLLQL